MTPEEYRRTARRAARADAGAFVLGIFCVLLSIALVLWGLRVWFGG